MRKKISVIVTVKQDNLGVVRLLKNLAKQTRKPDEVITIRAEDYHNCSRAEGRNIGIRNAKYSIIAVTDVGCRPYQDWLQKLVAPIEAGAADVVAGFYHVVASTPFQRAVAPYLASYPQPCERYLPASRSIAFTKEAWKRVGGYPEEARSAGEDLEFARRLSRDPRIRIKHVPTALVDWEPPETLLAYFRSIRDHTRSNFEARIMPHIIRNLTVPLRWILFLSIPMLIPFYFLWPIIKHGKGQTLKGLTLQRRQVLAWLPIVQLVTDAAILVTLFHLDTWSGLRTGKQV